jgi:hypothetical protein
MILSWTVNLILLGLIFWFVDNTSPIKYPAFSFSLVGLVTTLVFYWRLSKAPF